MSISPLTRVVRHVCRQVHGPGPSDGQLLSRFIDHSDPTAADALVRRHGPMVMSVCRRLLRHPQDAEDAFQATFLVLVRKAATVKPRELVGHWLYGIARMTAVRARAAAAKRRAREEPLMDLPDSAPRPDTDLAAAIDEELSRLPEKYRVPIVLCDLGGKSHREAAEQLGWPQGTVSGRLFRGRQMLAARLARRGVVTTAAAVAAVLAEGVSAARVSSSLSESTVIAASLIAAGETAAGLSGEVAALTEGVVKTMLLTKLKVVGTSLAVLVVCGAGALGLRSNAADPPEKKVDPPAARRPSSVVRVSPTELMFAPTENEAKMSAADLAQLQGLWVLVDGVDNGHALPAGMLNNECMVIRKDRYSNFVQDGTKLGHLYGGVEQASNGRLHLYADAEPKTLIGSMKWPIKSVQHGIYELNGDTLRMCSGGKPENIRPDDFTCEKGSFKTVCVFKRSKETEQTKKQERLAHLRERMNPIIREVLETDEDEEVLASPVDHDRWRQEKLDEISRVLKAWEEPVKPRK
jgi:RNA polymerase sigma factor (sigma-70 family)